jgi:alpha-1,3-rhamnosyl/mannosyltransferase
MRQMIAQYPEVAYSTILGNCYGRNPSKKIDAAKALLPPEKVKYCRNIIPRRLFKFFPAITQRFLLHPPCPVADIYHITGNFGLKHMPRKVHRRQVVTIHDISFLRLFGSGCWDLASDIYMKEAFQKTLDTTDIILTVSQFTKDEVVDVSGFPAEKIIVAPLGSQWVLWNKPLVEDENIITDNGLENGKYFLSVGTLSPRKNFETLINAFVEFNKTTPGSKLVIAGRDGWQTESIKQHIENHKDCVVWLQGTNDAQLRTLYRHACALVLVSLYEGFGLPLLEAMQCDTPVCCSNTTSLVETVGNAGLTVPPEDTDAIAEALHLLWSAPEERARLVDLGRKRATEFSWEITAEKTFEAYQLALQ